MDSLNLITSEEISLLQKPFYVYAYKKQNHSISITRTHRESFVILPGTGGGRNRV
jgi:hypothetical protein